MACISQIRQSSNFGNFLLKDISVLFTPISKLSGIFGRKESAFHHHHPSKTSRGWGGGGGEREASVPLVFVYICIAQNKKVTLKLLLPTFLIAGIPL